MLLPSFIANSGLSSVYKSTVTKLNFCRCICYAGAFAGLNNFQTEFLGNMFDSPIHYLLLRMCDGLHKAACCCFRSLPEWQKVY